MANKKPNYVVQQDKDTITILEPAFITPTTVSTFKYAFSKPSDITESLSSKSTEKSEKIAKTHTGRTGFAPLVCTYPDESTSSKVVFTGVIIQYIKGITSERSTYARDYIFIGFPELYIETISKQAKTNSGITVKPKDRETRMSGYYWMRCNLEHLTVANSTITITDSDEDVDLQISVYDALTATKQHFFADITATVSASLINKSMAQELDLINGTYHFTIKPTQVQMIKEAEVEAPTLKDQERRNIERSEPSASAVASGKLAALALSRLSINPK